MPRTASRLRQPAFYTMIMGVEMIVGGFGVIGMVSSCPSSSWLEGRVGGRHRGGTGGGWSCRASKFSCLGVEVAVTTKARNKERMKKPERDVNETAVEFGEDI